MLRELFIDYLMRFVGTRYKWGGENPISGFDCSGLISEGLMAVGVLGGRTSAQGIYNEISPKATRRLDRGSVVFFGPALSAIHHIGVIITPGIMIEAGNGNHLINTVEDSDLANAFVRVRSTSIRKDLVIGLLPNEFL